MQQQEREILFRGKRVDNVEWVYGYFVIGESDGLQYIIPKNNMYENVKVVCDETVGQYTGLTDKNGVKIFEGDIVKLKDYHGDRTVRIFWGDCGVWCYGGDGYSDEYIFNASEKCEVIGNIHDNPELLEGGDRE